MKIELIYVIIIAIAALAIGAVIGFIIRKIGAEKKIGSAEEQARKILEDAIKNAEKIVILTHEAPDGDAIGSSLAMMHALKKLGKESDVIIPEYSRLFSFLPGSDKIKSESSIEEYDLAIALDCGDIKRLKYGEEYFDGAKRKIQIETKY